MVLAYAYLTGKPPLPPLWSLGFQQSRYSYTPESQIREIANHLRADKIPSDVLYLDIDYQDRNRPFTVDPVRFPKFEGLVSDLRKQHFHLVVITDLHIAHVAKQHYMPYDTGHAGDHFIKKADGSEFVGVVWPGPAVFPDFTRAQTREWWGSLYKGFVDQGVSGFWNDMNEPSVFDGPAKTMPLDNIHRIEEPGFATRTATHAEIHNVLGMENERATYEGLLKLRPNERPFVLTRATYAGGQRYSFTWTGDNSATWNHVRLATQMLLNLGMSGISMVGDDIGGFNGSPSPDLLTSWIEIGAFNPMYRDHTTLGSLPQEVWVHGTKHEAIRRRYIETRYRLLPYIYTLAEEASRTGLPLMRPLFMEFPGYFDSADTEFLLGHDMLIAPPPFGEMMDDYAVSYPPGDWFDFWTGKKAAHQPAQPDITTISNTIAAGESLGKFTPPVTIHPTLETLPVGQQPHHPLVPALHHHERVVIARPARRDQVGERGAVGLDLHGGAVKTGQQQGHLGVRSARGRIGHLGGSPVRVSRVGDVPPVHRRLVHPRRQQRRSVRRPPVAAGPAHLLGRDELRQPERHARGGREDLIVGRALSGCAAQAGHPQRAGPDVGQPLPGRVGARIQHRAWHRHLARGGVRMREADREDPPRPSEDRHRQVRVRGVGHDAAGVLPDPLPAGPLLRRQVLRRRPASSGPRPAVPCRCRRPAPTGRSPGRRRPGCAGTPPGRRRVRCGTLAARRA